MASGEVVEVFEGPVLAEIYGGLDEGVESFSVPSLSKGFVKVFLELLSGGLKLIFETDFKKKNELLIHSQVILNVELKGVDINLTFL